MGMAAGQARLLSITSRMSDNELRAQIINNDKMRLATKSAQVSEAYTTALNEAQLMFTSYDKDNNSSYKELTFNALTAYNQYNNQYAISNSAGQLLVSETDAKNFQAADGDMNKFLKQYHLEQTTTYFEGLEKYQGANVSYYDSNGKLIKGTANTGVVYNTGEIVDAEINGEKVTKNVQVDSGITAKELKKMYEGDGYESYDNIKASPYYYDYSAALSNFTEAKTNFETKAAEIMNNLFETIRIDSDGSKHSISDISQLLASATDTDNAKKYIKLIKDNAIPSLQEFSLKNNDDVDAYYAFMTKLLDDALDGKASCETSNLTTNPDTGDEITLDGGFKLTKDSSGNWTAKFYETNEEGQLILGAASQTVTVGTDGKLSFDNGKTGDEKVSYEGIPVPVLNSATGKYEIPSGTFSEIGELDVDDYKAIGQQVIDSLINAMPNTFDTSTNYFKKNWIYDKTNNKISWQPNGCEEANAADSVEYAAYKDAAAELYETIYGEKMPPRFDENDFAKLADLNEIEALGKRYNTPLKGDKLTQFANIKQVTLLDNIMNTYGEPTYDWIDTSARPGKISDSSYNQNGSAKAQWYENLFNKMKTSGYKVLHDGLASSAEWMQFAFESGLVCLEQVDSNNNWSTTTYTNCSDITEQTNNAAITKAEAEYNAAMAKIENKDKRYDLELKNIDTEHNSLQTEYDSIKTAIDKNIERTFKIYS